MSTRAGIWIDHRRAFIVALSAHGERTTLILSTAEKHPERGGDSPLKGPYEAHSVPADDRQQRTLTAALNDYYDAVIAAIDGYDTLFLFGPGEAKGELHARLSKTKAKEPVVTFETADKMTDHEIIAKVCEHFGRGAARI